MTNEEAKSVINELKLYVEDLPSYSSDDVSETLEDDIDSLPPIIEADVEGSIIKEEIK